MPSGLLDEDVQQPDDRDGMRFLIGLYLALNYESEGSIRQINEILANPTIPSSRWIETASIFLSNYYNPSDLDEACAAVGVCYQLLGERTLVELFGSQSQSSSIIDYLESSGVPIISHGTVDVNSDGCTDYWMVFSPSDGYEPEQSMILCWEGGYKILYLYSDINVDLSVDIEVVSSIDGFQVFSINGDDELNVLSQSGEEVNVNVSIHNYEWYIRDNVDGALTVVEHNLITGVPLQDILNELQTIEAFVRELEQMEPPPYLENSIPQWYYLYGLTNELLGNTEMAVQAYLNAWEFYSNDPYGMMASARLQPVQQP